MQKKLIVLITSVLLSATSQANIPSIGVKISTLGAGIEIKNQISDNSSVRLGYFGGSFNSNITESNIDYAAEFKAKNIMLAADYHIASSPLKVSAGLVKYSDVISMDVDVSSGTLDLAGYSADSSHISEFGGSINIEDTAPYVGIGLSSTPDDEGFGFTLDFGATTAPEVTASLSVTCAVPGSAECTTIQDHVVTENTQLENDFEGITKGGFFPVISTGISYKF